MNPDLWAVEPPQEAAFDRGLNTWVLSRYRDVAEALRDPRLVPALARATGAVAGVDEAAHAQFRAQAIRTLAPSRLRQWEAQFEAAAGRIVRALPAGQPVDLVAGYAKPWSLEVASIAAGVPPGDAERLAGLARAIFLSAGDPYDVALETASRNATVELARLFHAAPAIHMQMFIALAQSLPAFLGNAWMVLIEHPSLMVRVQADPALLPGAIDELLRFAGPARVQFRRALADVAGEGFVIPAQAAVMLRLDRANRDPEFFPDPGELRFDHRNRDHVAFGGGVHACVGGALVRSAAALATRVLMDRFRLPAAATATPANCFAMRYLQSLIVVLE